MLFIELRFFVFLAAVLAVKWTLRANAACKAFLLVCSYFFYACFFVGDPVVFAQNAAAARWDRLPAGWWFPLVLMGSTCMDYIVGLGIEGAASQVRRRAWVVLSLCTNLGTLCYFKYFNLFLTSAGQFLAWLGVPASAHTLRILLPYGVSFYTFQSLSYTLEVYRRHIRAERKFLDLAFFISFFPQLVAGPIVRATAFLPQTKAPRRWADVDVRGALVLFMTGFAKKTVVAENVAPAVDAYFADPGRFNALSAWIAVLFYAVQIYCDFSGYTDMAIATARLLGYELTLNFDFPYFSRSVTEFWRRWHISLSTWLRDYLYISLGGNRGSRLFTWRNLMLTMLLGGLWHGASWVFAIWGGLHGLALIVNREWSAARRGGARAPAGAVEAFGLREAAATLATFYFVCVCWIYFRAADLHKAGTVLRAFVRFRSHGRQTLDPRFFLLFAGLALIHWLNYRRVFAAWWRRMPDLVFSAGYGVAAALILLFIPQRYTPFIYFQF